MRECILRAHVWLVAGLLPLAVRFIGLKRLLRMLTPPRWWRPYRRVPPKRLLATVRRRLVRPIHMKRRRCLRQGLLTYHFLMLAGIDAVVRFSVCPDRPGDLRMHAHCWVTVGEKCVTFPAGDDSVEMMTFNPQEVRSNRKKTSTS